LLYTKPGLQLKNREGEWEPVEATDNQLVVNVGDMFERLTNGVFRSTPHRVLSPDGFEGDRYSSPFFMHMNPDYVISPLESCLQPSDVPTKPIPAHALLLVRLRQLDAIPQEVFMSLYPEYEHELALDKGKPIPDASAPMLPQARDSSYPGRNSMS